MLHLACLKKFLGQKFISFILFHFQFTCIYTVHIVLMYANCYDTVKQHLNMFKSDFFYIYSFSGVSSNCCWFLVFWTELLRRIHHNWWRQLQTVHLGLELFHLLLLQLSPTTQKIQVLSLPPG